MITATMTTATRIRAAMVKLQAVCPKSMPIVDMAETHIRKDECGTTACFAGWYELACQVDEGTVRWTDDGCLRRCKSIGAAPFRDGSGRLALDLGFKSDEALSDWALCLPEIWGNSDGDSMFSSPFAFGKQAVTLQDIIDHWHGVADRLEATQGAA